MAKVTVDLDGLIKEIRTIAENASKPVSDKKDENMPGKDIAGMKDMAIENARILWSWMHGIKSTDGSNSHPFGVPELGIMTKSKDGIIHAFIVYKPSHNSTARHNFIQGSPRASVGAAVESLLETTMVAVEKHREDNFFHDSKKQWVAACLPNGSGAGWYRPK